MKRVCLVPRLSGVGGMVSFQHKLMAGFQRRGIDVCQDLDEENYQAILVIGGYRKINRLLSARRHGVRLVQRLDGMNWIHRVQKTSLRQFIRSEASNWLLAYIRRKLAQHIIYQSEFSKVWWQNTYGVPGAGNSIIYNGVDLGVYTPEGENMPPDDCWRLLLVEGSLLGGYQTGIEMAVQLGQELDRLLKHPDHRALCKPVEIMVVGRVDKTVQDKWNQQLAGSDLRLSWRGLVPRETIPDIDRSAHLLFSTDLNAACPNSVIEALSCGLPVVAFDTGSLPELVQNGAGRIVPYGGNPWKLEKPDINGLTQAVIDILANQSVYRQSARKRAEAMFGLDPMVDAYQKVLLDA